ncbi:p-hydroxycinnamoyl CoA hydratase/lyase [Dactylosporangium roseum]|uniref:p-hydroxycinnamoyl CoA hydratase/lyase n=1 Tax=Dactylosporangium roseum TaxID=47989 RepID=A0ABY5ZCT8_9ACTN|nr:p-hydroxycinnamoyl CoA hydratase/lyase [Dactylosporangium roseum]UWZ39232.1 p-hydroxycinnamoyl CoA hydratase/lyase [Dactylosporangium roseum]
MSDFESNYETVLVDQRDDGATWITFNRPEKRNAMNPTMHYEMVDVLGRLEADDRTRVLIFTGAGNSWVAGQDIEEYFRQQDNDPVSLAASSRASQEWRWRRLWTYPKPTIAMVNGWCFGGGFTQLTACDLAIAADEAKFGLSEVNWGILPGGYVSRAIKEVLGYRDIMRLILTGDPIDGKEAERLGLVNKSVPLAELRDETERLVAKLLEKNSAVLNATKQAYKFVKDMGVLEAEEYLKVKQIALRATDPEKGRDNGTTQFLDDKTYRPGLGSYDRKVAQL